MRFFAPILALLAAVSWAQNQPNYITVPNGGLQIKAGSNTINWINPTSGTVTLKLQQGAITPSSGYVLASGIDASAKMATFNIPAGLVNSSPYTIEIVDDTNPNVYNFCPPFTVQGATGTATGFPSSSATGTVTGTSTGSTSTASSASSASTASTKSSSSAQTTKTSTASSTSTSSSSTSSSAPTSAPNSGADGLRVHSGLIALMAVAAAL